MRKKLLVNSGWNSFMMGVIRVRTMVRRPDPEKCNFGPGGDLCVCLNNWPFVHPESFTQPPSFSGWFYLRGPEFRVGLDMDACPMLPTCTMRPPKRAPRCSWPSVLFSIRRPRLSICPAFNFVPNIKADLFRVSLHAHEMVLRCETEGCSH